MTFELLVTLTLPALARAKACADHFRAFGCMINKGCYDSSWPVFRSFSTNRFISILVTVVGTGAVVHAVLNILETRDANRVERLVVGTAGVGYGNGCCAQIL